MKSSIPFGNGTKGTTDVDMVDANGHGAANGKISNGNGHETNGHMNGNGVAHTNGHSENGINKSEFERV